MVPKSPYGVSKLYSYWITKIYRQLMDFACNGILLIMKVQDEVKHLSRKIKCFCKKNLWIK